MEDTRKTGSLNELAAFDTPEDHACLIRVRLSDNDLGTDADDEIVELIETIKCSQCANCLRTPRTRDE